MLARAAAVVAIVLVGCVGSRSRPDDSGLYVGHSTNGEVVVAATHYDAMAGLATTADELGIKSTDKDQRMICQREMPTGTHVPRWICRYQQDILRERQLTRDWLDQPRLSFAKGLQQ